MADILVSYRREERATAEALASQLADSGLSVGLVPRFAGDKPSDNEIDENSKQIDEASCVITLWSRAASGERFVLLEAQRAASQRKLVIADLQNAALPPTIAGRPLVDISGWLLTREAAELKPLEGAVNSVAEAIKKAARTFKPDIYLAYVRKNEREAEMVFRVLEEAGYDVWWDRKIAAGALWEREINSAFFKAKMILLLASRQGLSSKYMEYYIQAALRRGVPLLIAELERIPDSDYPLALRPAERIDLFSWSESRDGRKLSPLFRSIESLIGPPSKPPPPAPGGSPTPKAQDVQRPGHDVFVSYKREDRPKVTPFVTRLMGGGLQVWWDALIRPGSNWGLAVERALKEARSVAVFWTPLSVRSDEVYTEADYGLHIDACPLHGISRDRQNAAYGAGNGGSGERWFYCKKS